MPALLSEARPFLAIALLGGMLVAFMRERLPPSVVAVSGAALFVVLGLVPTDQVLGVFSNEAPIAIGALFVLSGALVRTGALEAVASRVLALAKTRPRGALIALFGGTMVASAFMNNTPVVIVLIPIVSALASQLGVSRQRLLIPLSFVTILGGTCTLIGTSTNLLVAGMADARGAADLGIFSVTAVGLVTAAVGVGALTLLGPRLLPVGGTHEGEASKAPSIITEARLREGAKSVGTSLGALRVTMPRGVSLVAAFRGKDRLSTQNGDAPPARANDRLVLRVTEEELLTLARDPQIDLGVQARAPSTAPIERITLTLGPNDPAIGSPLKAAPFLSRFPVRVIGALREGHAAGPSLPEMTLRPGDKLWVEATANTVRQLREQATLIVSGDPLPQAFRRERVTLAVGVMAGVVVLAAFGTLPISVLGLLGVAAILATRCLDAQEAWRSIDFDVLVLIFAMLIVGRGLDESGAIALIVQGISPWLQDHSGLVLLLGLYALTSTLTEMVTNNAVAVIMTPLAISFAQALGVDAEPLILAVMFAASASFATPVGYQTNTLVYAAGGYRFADFLRVGVPMNVIVGLATCVAIELFYGV